jgi:hypothetical protein
VTLRAILLALRLLGTSVEDREDPRLDAHQELIASSIHDAAQAEKMWPGSKDELERLMLVVGKFESGFAIRIGEGKCKRFECDPHLVNGEVKHRARGFWQSHANRRNAQAWEAMGAGDEASIRLAAKEAARALTVARFTCQGTSSDWVRVSLRAYAGSACWKAFKGEEERVKAYRKLEGKR